jgi:hypothetical protein
VSRGNRIECLTERSDVQFTGKPQWASDVIGGAFRFEAAEKPKALLRKRCGRRFWTRGFLAQEISEQRALLGCGELQSILQCAIHLARNRFWHQHT